MRPTRRAESSCRCGATPTTGSASRPWCTESDNVVSVYVTGRHLDKLPARAGQFCFGGSPGTTTGGWPTPIGGARRNRAAPHGEGGGQHQRRPAKRPGRQPRLRRGTVRGVHLAAPDPAERSGPGTLRGSVRRHEDRRPALLAPGREETQEGTAPPVPQGQGIEEQGQGSHQGRPARTRGWPTHGASSTTSAQRGSFAITRRLPLRTWR
jgi:hypothetical protein